MVFWAAQLPLSFHINVTDLVFKKKSFPNWIAQSKRNLIKLSDKIKIPIYACLWSFSLDKLPCVLHLYLFRPKFVFLLQNGDDQIIYRIFLHKRNVDKVTAILGNWWTYEKTLIFSHVPDTIFKITSLSTYKLALKGRLRIEVKDPRLLKTDGEHELNYSQESRQGKYFLVTNKEKYMQGKWLPEVCMWKVRERKVLIDSQHFRRCWNNFSAVSLTLSSTAFLYRIELVRVCSL